MRLHGTISKKAYDLHICLCKNPKSHKTYTVHIINNISELQHFVAHCLSSYAGNVFGLHNVCVNFPSTHKLVIKAKHGVWLRVLYHRLQCQMIGLMNNKCERL
jgi:hypothetical protein